MKRSSLHSCSLRSLQPLRQCAAVLMAFLTLFYGQQAAAQTSSCTAPAPSTTPPSNTLPTLNPNLSLNINNQQIPLAALNLVTTLAGQLITPSSSAGTSPITINSANGPCSAVYPVLIQNWCAAPSLANDILQFQGDIAAEFLSLFHIPAADGPTALQIIAGRANPELLSSYYGLMLAEIEALLYADPSTLTGHENNVVAWFNSLVWQHEKDLYNAAEQEKTNFLNNSCGYTPDADLAKQYNLQFNINQCSGTGALFGNPDIPPASYFLAVGLKNSYGAAVSGSQGGPALNFNTIIEKSFYQRAGSELGTGLKTAWTDADTVYAALGASTGAGVSTAILSSQLFFKVESLSKNIFPYAWRQITLPKILKDGKMEEDTKFLQAAESEGETTEEEVLGVMRTTEQAAAAEAPDVVAPLTETTSEFAVLEGPGALASAGPAAIVAIFVAILTESIDQLVNYEQAMSDYASLDQSQNAIQTQPVNAASFIGNDQGEYKLAATLIAAALPFPQPATPSSEQGEETVRFRIADASNNVTISPSVTLADWNLLSQTVTLAGGWFSETERAGSGPAVVSRTPIIHYLDWNGRQWWAARFGVDFLAVKNGYEHQDEGDQFQDVGACGDGTPSPMSDDALFQPQQPSSGVQNAYCSSFVTHKLHVKDDRGNNLVLEIGAVPQVGSGAQNANATFQPGQSVTYAVPPISGFPTPTVSVTGLPSGFKSTTLSDGTVEIVDTNLTAKTTSVGTITVTAVNSYATQSLAINVTENLGSATPTITGPSQLNLQGGKPFSATFRIMGDAGHQLDSISYTSGLSLFGAIPLNASGTVTGLKVSLNPDGSYTISGVPVLQVLQSSFVVPAPGTLLTGAITISASGAFFNQAEGTFQDFSTTQSFPFSYKPSVDPVYAIKNVVMYTGQDNEVLIQPVTPTGAPLFYPFNITGDAGCAYQIILLANPNDGSFVFSSQKQIPSVKHCAVTFTAQVPGDLLPQYVNPIQPTVTFPVTFLTIPKFTNISNPVFPASLPVSFNLTTTSPAKISFSGTLPAGLQFATTSDSGGVITGTPAAGSGGEYKVTFTAQSADGSSTQILDIKVPEAPKITSTSYVSVPAGQDYTFNVTTTGYPNLSSDPCGGMNFTLHTVGGVTPVISQVTNKNLAFDSTGTLKLTFPANGPQAGAVSQVGISVSNSVGTDSQFLTLYYRVPGDANGDGVANCLDVAAISYYRGQKVNSALWPLDLNNDGVIDVADISVVNSNLPKGTSCSLKPGQN